MKKVILALLLAALAVIPLHAGPVPQASVRPLFYQVTEDDGQTSWGVGCTATSINEQIGLWLTARHCISPNNTYVGQPQPDEKYVMHATSVTFEDAEADVAILFTKTLRVTAATLSNKEPVVDDKVTMIGFPFGFTEIQRWHGTVSNIRTHISAGGTDYGVKTTYDMIVCGGNSGSPILNEAGEIVGIAQLGPGRPCASFSAGTPYKELKRLVGKFFTGGSDGK